MKTKRIQREERKRKIVTGNLKMKEILQKVSNHNNTDKKFIIKN